MCDMELEAVRVLLMVEQHSQRSVYVNLVEGMKEDSLKFGEEMRALILEVLELNCECLNIM